MASTPGIRARHSADCKSRDGGKCNCTPTYEAFVYSKRDKKKIRKSFTGTRAFPEAKGWRADALGAVKNKRLHAPASTTLRTEVETWLAGARDGSILSKRQRPYKPAVIRNYELALRLRVLDALGDRRLTSIDHRDLLDLQEQLLADGCTGSTLRNTFTPLQAIFRRARRRGVIAVNPALDLELPVAGTRDRAATPGQAVELLETLEGVDPAIWATAFYAGLRRGEIRGLRVADVDLEAATIQVERGWDDKEGAVDPKSVAGRRRVFVSESLAAYLEPLIEGHAAGELVFGIGSEVVFDVRALDRRAKRRWNAIDAARATEADERGAEAAELERFTLHEARHSFSTWLDHAGVSETRADRYMGHSSGSVAGRYRHLLPGQLAEDRKRFDLYVGAAVSGKVVALSA